jgi:hypothetical protein
VSRKAARNSLIGIWISGALPPKIVVLCFKGSDLSSGTADQANKLLREQNEPFPSYSLRLRRAFHRLFRRVVVTKIPMVIRGFIKS